MAFPTKDLELAGEHDDDSDDNHGTQRTYPDDQLELALEAMGLRAEQALPDAAPDTHAKCFPECLPVIHCWMALQTQWQFTPLGTYAGLNYAGVSDYLRAQGYRRRAKGRKHLGTMLDDLRSMERAVLDVHAERRAR